LGNKTAKHKEKSVQIFRNATIAQVVESPKKAQKTARKETENEKPYRIQSFTNPQYKNPENNKDSSDSKNNILTSEITPIYVCPRKNTRFWKSPIREIGIIFNKDDSPEKLRKHERLQNIILQQIGVEEKILAKKYIFNHPVMKLLERNFAKLKENKTFVDGTQTLIKIKETNHAVPQIDYAIKGHTKYLSFKRPAPKKTKTEKKLLSTTCYL